MRIWSLDLIEVLPKKQLLAMRYELGNMIKQYPNIKHGLVKFVNNYPIIQLRLYFNCVISECEKREYNISEKYNEEILEIINTKASNPDMWCYFKYTEDNDRYLRECVYNLEEKAMRNIISKAEWQKIYEKYKDKFDLWGGE